MDTAHMIACGILGGVDSDSKLTSRKRELIRALRQAGINKLEIALTPEQLSQIDEARADGKKINIVLSIE